MLVELKQDALDDLYRKMIVEDWKLIKYEIKSLKGKENLPPHRQEDLDNIKKLKKAYERIIRYHYTREEALEIIGKPEKVK
jgi:hypothetical protein